ncbi:MAG TPA: glycosyltransferase, partial [Opitutus sp.]|nr:glycosyltransferase [Opitutus sp.]
MPAPSETIQLFWNSGADVRFNEVASVRLNYHHDSVQHVFFSVRDRLQPWRIDPSSSDAASVIHRIAVYSDNHTVLGSFAGEQLNSLAVSTLHDTSLVASSVGLAIQASSGDPQLQISFRDNPALNDAAWLELELYTDRQAQGRLPKPNVRETCRIEEARWLDLAPQKFRIAGWYHDSEHAAVKRFSAIISGAVVASAAPLPRPDVQSHFDGAAAALLSGFQLDLPSSAADQVVSLLVEDVSGKEFYFDSVAVSTPPKRAVLVDDYRLWAEQHDPDPPASNYTIESKLKFSILLPVYNTDLAHLQQCLSSVRHQHYQNWELCVVDDGSTQTVRGVIDEARRTDQRIKFKRRVVNGGIARATNEALEMAKGDYVVLLDHDDLVRPHALAEFAAKLTEDPKLDVVYSDEDKIDPHGVRTAPLLKPDFSPAFLRGTMFVGHLLCVRTTLARSIGGFDPAYDGVQDYEFFLRLRERTSSIGHVRRILYHWRMSPSSSAMAGNVKGNMDELQLRAVQAHLARTHRSLEAVALGGHRIRLQPSEVDLTGECTVIFLDANDAKDFKTTPVIIAPTRDSSGVLAAAKLATTRFVLVVT